MRIAEKIKTARNRAGLSQQELAEKGDSVACTLREPMMAEDPEEAVRIRWPEAVRSDWMLLRHDFGPAGRILNAVSFGWFGAAWRVFHGKECDANRCRMERCTYRPWVDGSCAVSGILSTMRDEPTWVF